MFSDIDDVALKNNFSFKLCFCVLSEQFSVNYPFTKIQQKRSYGMNKYKQ